MSRSRQLRRGIGRSLDIYYRDTARACRMDMLNACMVSRGALVFDIGAHVGDRTASFLRLGASVVALEPQPLVYRALRLLHGRRPEAVLLPLAAGRAEGEITLHLNRANPTVSTVEPGFIAAAAGSAAWRGQVWDACVPVPVTTLDALIRRFGRPDFVKIDVEGHEAEVLAGLSAPVGALSFEFTTIQRGAARACIDRLDRLGPYVFNLSLGEEHRFRSTCWVGPAEMRARLDALPDAANSGDVHARLLRPA